MSPRPPDRDRLMIDSLHAAALRHVENDTPLADVVAELRWIATQQPRGRPAMLRVDLLSYTAGIHLGSHRADPGIHWAGKRAARLLVDAGGTDQEVVANVATETYHALTQSRHGSSAAQDARRPAAPATGT